MKILVSFIFIYFYNFYIVLAIVSNKSDLFDKEQVTEDEGKEFADEINALFFSVSAYTGANINLLFDKIGVECLKLKENENLTGSIKLTKIISMEKYEEKKKNCSYC